MSGGNGKPKFVHDCDRCEFLGHTHAISESRDWYVCTEATGWRSIIARFGDYGAEYTSMLICSIPTHVLMLALALGLELTPLEKDALLGYFLKQEWNKKLYVNERRAFYEHLPDDINELPFGQANWLEVTL